MQLVACTYTCTYTSSRHLVSHGVQEKKKRIAQRKERMREREKFELRENTLKGENPSRTVQLHAVKLLICSRARNMVGV